MTISSETRKAGPTPGNGVAIAFPFAFKVFNAVDISVVLNTLASGLQQTLVLNTDYTVLLNPDQNANPGGTVTYNPASGPLPATQTLTIGSVVTRTQGTHLINGGSFLADNIENMVDRAVIGLQQLAEQLARSIRFPFVDNAPVAELPTAALRKGRMMGFDPVTGDVALFSTTPTIYGVLISKFVAADGQQVFPLGFTYTPGINAITVYLNGLRLVTIEDFAETDQNTITTTFGLRAGDKLVAVSGQEQSNAAVYDATLVQYLPGTDPATNVAAQLKKFDVVDTIAALKAKTTPGVKHAVLVLGYAAAGDGGGGFYYWNAADVTADNGGTVIQLNAGGNGRFNKLFF